MEKPFLLHETRGAADWPLICAYVHYPLYALRQLFLVHFTPNPIIINRLLLI